MPAYRELEPGLFELDSPGGPLTVTATEDELRSNGHFPESLSLHKTGATAQNGGAGGVGNVPETATDVPRNQYAQGGRPSQMLDQDILDGASGDPSKQKLSPDTEVMSITRETFPMKAGEPLPKGLRGGGEVKDIGEGMGAEPPAPKPRFAKVGGKDIRAGFNIQKSLLDPDDVEAAELAEADASIDRKLAAQNIAERRGTQTEALSAEMGRQIRAEGVALRQQEERNRAQAEDYQRRQSAIEAEREEVAKLAVNPADLVGEGGLTGVVAALTMLAGGFGAAYNGGRNLAIEAIQGNLDRKLEQAKQKVAGKESEFDRLVKLYGSPAEAEAEFRDRQRLMVQSLGQKMALDAGANDAADQLRMQFADWDDERARSRLQRQEALAGRVTEQWAYQPEKTIQIGGPRPLTPDQRKRQVQVGGRTAFVAREGDAKGVQDSVSGIEHIEEQLDRMRQIASQTGVSDIEKQRQLEALSESIGPAMAVLQGQGAMSKDEAERTQSRIGNAQSFLGSAERANTLIGETKQFFSAKKKAVVRGSVYADPDATTPLVGGQSGARRYE